MRRCYPIDEEMKKDEVVVRKDKANIERALNLHVILPEPGVNLMEVICVELPKLKKHLKDDESAEMIDALLTRTHDVKPILEKASGVKLDKYAEEVVTKMSRSEQFILKERKEKEQERKEKERAIRIANKERKEKEQEKEENKQLREENEQLRAKLRQYEG